MRASLTATILFFGLAVGVEPELGYFRLSELQSVRGTAWPAGRAGQVFRAHTLA